ncbi:hypothetical protein [Prescottella equi]|uniref:hypothetical protein n=1 Tax=Rhodococcus hoagii TaxID=43767 RepID=UPI0009C01D0E|nr:hypothetical protein [Prescottella equi]MBM4725286.1 hypothetical protein [Prescottella equi]NKR24518.1 hypothetical protein [Prescottella equi]NKR42754.1 hypothetical protein [Prescottella equi]NKS80349.1 hypothetical protein [Prescottella equi]OQQ32025.1 hypothetical protein A6411_09320 [Prescottella equi]
MTRDVEKRWSDPRTFRRAALYDGATIVLALIAMVVTIVVGSGTGDCAPDEGRLCTDTARIVVVVVPSALLLLGGIGAFVQAYRVWRRAGTWPIWQAAGWVLFVLMLVYLGIAVRSVAG